MKIDGMGPVTWLRSRGWFWAWGYAHYPVYSGFYFGFFSAWWRTRENRGPGDPLELSFEWNRD